MKDMKNDFLKFYPLRVIKKKKIKRGFKKGLLTFFHLICSKRVFSREFCLESEEGEGVVVSWIP